VFVFIRFSGAPTRTRTADLLITNRIRGVYNRLYTSQVIVFITLGVSACPHKSLPNADPCDPFVTQFKQLIAYQLVSPVTYPSSRL